MENHALTSTRRDKLYVVVEIVDNENTEHARTAGADEVVRTNSIGLSLIAHSISHPGTADILSSVVTLGGMNVYVGSVPDRYAQPLPYGQLVAEQKKQDGVLVIGVRRGATEVVNPPEDFVVQTTDTLVYLSEQPLPGVV